MTDPTRVSMARAKINLSLRVLAREQSGYHQIETLFCALDLADEVVVDVGDDEVDTLVVVAAGTDEPPDLGPVETNLAWRAADLFRRAVPGASSARITLTKRIPHGAGLGGGSSDAAAVLAAMNALQKRPLEDSDLLRLGARLGSDVPFFLSATPLALAWGRGNRLLPAAPLPVATVLLAVPAEKVPTADAYAALAHVRQAAPQPYRDEAALEPAVLTLPRTWQEAGAAATNDFEDLVFSRIPLLAGLRDSMSRAGACVARMTGTGSVVFGVFEDPEAADRARRSLAAMFPDVRWLITTTLSEATPGGGFEPPLADPKSAVLPLDDPGSRH